MELTIFHTNDIHSSFTGLDQASTYLKKHRRPGDLYFDCGDLCDLKDITVQGTSGKGAVLLMKQACAWEAIPTPSAALTDTARQVVLGST